jgi:hypothetical protein
MSTRQHKEQDVPSQVLECDLARVVIIEEAKGLEDLLPAVTL